MKHIIVEPAYNGIISMYKRSNTNAQRALLGYVVKSGLAADPILCGAFNTLCEVEQCIKENQLYIPVPCNDANIATEIYRVAENAMLGKYDRYSFSARDIHLILKEFK